MVTPVFIRSIADVSAAVLNARVTHRILTTLLFDNIHVLWHGKKCIVIDEESRDGRSNGLFD